MKKLLTASVLTISLALSSTAQAFVGISTGGITPSFSNEEFDAARKLDWNDPEDREAIIILLSFIGVAIIGTQAVTTKGACKVATIPAGSPIAGIGGPTTFCGVFF